MGSGILVDTAFDVRADSDGRDPDRYSKTLRRYHQLLWGKALSSGATFDLDAQLHHNSDVGEFWLSSDAIAATYSRYSRSARLADVIRQVPLHEVNAFYDLACTVGAFLVFPLGVRVDGKYRLSINAARGLHPRIGDRFDLTLECIRLHYLGGTSPLADVLARHGDFFELFQDFRGYVDHFLLNDLVGQDDASVKFLTAFDGFAGVPLPAASVAEYRTYMSRSMDFVRARNERIRRYASSALHANFELGDP